MGFRSRKRPVDFGRASTSPGSQVKESVPNYLLKLAHEKDPFRGESKK